MSNGYLLDTNAVIDRRNNISALIDILNDADAIYIPAIVLGELYYGAEKSTYVEKNTRYVDELSQSITILDCDKNTAPIYGKITQQLRKKGRPIPVNDVWIAAIAIQYELVLLARDVHFDEVEGLTVKRWQLS